MEFVVYVVTLSGKILINITHNPVIDYIFYKSIDDDAEVYVLTPGLSISKAYHIMEDVKKRLRTVNRISYGNRTGARIALELVKISSGTAGIKAYRKPASVSGKIMLPGEQEQKILHRLLMGKVMTYSKLHRKIKEAALYIGSQPANVLQVLYLKDLIKLLPPLYTDGHGKVWYCSHCGHGICKLPDGEMACECCGALIDEYEPQYAAPYPKSNQNTVRFRALGNLSPVDNTAALELCSFLEDNYRECLLWHVPGADMLAVIKCAIKKVLAAGGRVLVASSLSERDMGISEIAGLKVCNFDSISDFYCSFDLVLLIEPVHFAGISAEGFHRQLVRALRHGGKIIISTTAPDYGTFERIERGLSRFVAMPVYPNGSLSPEPRVLTFRGLSEKNVFIPGEIVDFIKWSKLNKQEVTIVVPEAAFVDLLRYKLGRINAGSIPVISYPCINNISGNKIVFFADMKAIFNEKALLNVTIPLSSVCSEGGEVLYVGTTENDEIYNVKNMLRQFNKRAWEMGYIKG